MTKKRKTVVAITGIALALLLAVGMTLAYLTDQRTAKNALRIGADGDGNKAVEIVLDEHAFRETIEAVRAGKTNPDDYGKYTFTSIVPVGDPTEGDKYSGNTTDAALFNVMPAQKINKDPSLKNIGAGPVYIRFKLQTVNSAGAVVDIKEGDATHKLLTQSPTAALIPDMGFGLEINPSFTYNADGYYYYYTGSASTVFNSGDALDLFKTKGAAAEAHTMQTPILLDYSDLAAFGEDLNIYVVAEALQTEGVKTTIPWQGTDSTNPITANPQA